MREGGGGRGREEGGEGGREGRRGEREGGGVSELRKTQTST